MAEKRRASSRARGEGPAKKRLSVAQTPGRETPSNDKLKMQKDQLVGQRPSASSEEPLPAKIGDSRPLPTVDEHTVAAKGPCQSISDR